MDGLRNIYMGLWANHVWNWNWNLIRNAPFTAQSPLLALRSIQLMSGEPGSVLQLLGESAVSLCSQHVRFPKHSIYLILRFCEILALPFVREKAHRSIWNFKKGHDTFKQAEHMLLCTRLYTVMLWTTPDLHAPVALIINRVRTFVCGWHDIVTSWLLYPGDNIFRRKNNIFIWTTIVN